MCCLFTILVFLGPRVGSIFWWLFYPGRWDLAFSSIIWPILGILFAPWTTLMYVASFPGGVTGLDWLWIGLGIVADLGMYVGGGYGNRERIPGAR